MFKVRDMRELGDFMVSCFKLLHVTGAKVRDILLFLQTQV